jgi:hypothetical protein
MSKEVCNYDRDAIWKHKYGNDRRHGRCITMTMGRGNPWLGLWVSVSFMANPFIAMEIERQ